MTYLGIDLHKRESQICQLNEDGSVKELRIPSTKEAFRKDLSKLPGKVKVLLESSTSSEWVAQLLESFGFEVVVADPNYAPMMGSRRKRRVKTDRRDARALAEACRLGAYRAAHRMAACDRTARGKVAVRAQLVATRTRLISLVRAQILQRDEPLGPCSAESFVSLVRARPLSAEASEVVAPALEVIESLDTRLKKMDKILGDEAKSHPVAKLLMTVPGVGPLTAVTFVAVLGRAQRFESAAHVSAYIGLVPGEDSSGDGKKNLRITKTGNGYLRSLLVQCAWSMVRSKERNGLTQWVRRLAAKRSWKVAVVALARRLSRILWAIWRDGNAFDPAKLPIRELEAKIVEVAA